MHKIIFFYKKKNVLNPKSNKLFLTYLKQYRYWFFFFFEKLAACTTCFCKTYTTLCKKEGHFEGAILHPLHCEDQMERNGMYFHHGWEDCVAENCMEETYFLVFTYLGGKMFSIFVFDRTGCEAERVTSNGVAENNETMRRTSPRGRPRRSRPVDQQMQHQLQPKTKKV